jgi:hypothetical protein
VTSVARPGGHITGITQHEFSISLLRCQVTRLALSDQSGMSAFGDNRGVRALCGRRALPGRRFRAWSTTSPALRPRRRSALLASTQWRRPSTIKPSPSRGGACAGNSDSF